MIGSLSNARGGVEGRHYLIKDGEVTNVFSQRKHLDQDCHLSGAVPDFSKIDTIQSSLYEVGDLGKGHFPQTYSNDIVWRKGKLRIEQKKSQEQLDIVSKEIVLKKSEEYKQGSVKLFPEEYVRKSGVNDKMFVSRKVVIQEGTNIPMKFLRSGEFNMEGYMNRKQRVPSLDSQRNGIPVATMGDKAYKQVEVSDRYYETGGLIAGSTISLKKSKSVLMKKGGDNQARTVETKKLVSYKEKAAVAKKQEEFYDVHVLTNPYKKLNQVLPSWEEKTGFYIVRPEDEAD